MSRIRLSFRHKILLLPSLAGAGAALVLLAALVLSAHTAAEQRRIEFGYAPALDMDRELEGTLSVLQLKLQDAVAASDTGMVAQADSLAGEFQGALESGRKNPVLTAQELDSLRNEFTAYYQIARLTTGQMIRGKSNELTMTSLREMTHPFAALRGHLAERTQEGHAKVTAEFATVRLQQRTAMTVIAAILVVLVIGLAGLSRWILRDVLGTLESISHAAVRIANGEINQVVDYRAADEIGALAEAFRALIRYIGDIATAADALARGDLTVGVTPRSEHDVLSRNVTAARETLRGLVEEAGQLVAAAQAGDLGRRGNADRFQGTFRELVQGINHTLDAVVQPINEAATVLDRVARRDLTAAMVGDYHGDHARIKVALNTAVGEMRRAVATIGQNAAALATAAEELSTVSVQLGASADATSDRAMTVSTAAGQVNANVGSVASASDEMNASIRDIAHNANAATRVASDAVKMAQETNATVTQLGQSSREIDDVVKLITSIAQQTNLLALNATIEAARAGEAGAGFAVVAAEVKGLARQTASATEQVSRKIEAIQQDASRAVGAIREIGSVIGQISDIQSTIAGAVEEQAATTSEIARNVAEAARGSGDIATTIAGVAKAAGDTSAGAQQTQTSSQELARMASELQQLVGQFQFETDEQGGPIAQAVRPATRGKSRTAARR
jgi:methyl-accepting chemotaxis protein